MNLSQAKPTPKQLNLNKLSDAGGSQIHWQATLAKTDSSSDFGIILLYLNDMQKGIITPVYCYLNLFRGGVKSKVVHNDFFIT